MRNLTEMLKVVGALAPVDKAGNAIAAKPINMSNYRRVIFILYLGAWDSTGTITVEAGSTTSLGTAKAFHIQKASTGAAAYSVLDVAQSDVAAGGEALTAGDDNKIIAVEIRDTDVDTSGPYVGLKIGASGSANLVSIIALAENYRYPQSIPTDPTT